MKGLFITRGIDQQVQLFVDPNADPHELLRQMTDGITLRVSDISSSWARLHIQAPRVVQIIRPEKHSVEEWQGRPKARQPFWRRLLLGLRAPAAGQ